MEIHGVNLRPAITSKVEWIGLIYTGRGWEVWMRDK